ncbi:hypothetical protein NPIL_417571 [Nephila pilipes]|uniref:DUF5641 domain-containing protein n=1 Tax=Nephila pilipes TaxID=299642 RepID=A0A8X6IHM8_NEPPI|nr:hypothetical protein NPIL_417571 [Nephila pilipes]
MAKILDSERKENYPKRLIQIFTLQKKHTARAVETLPSTLPEDRIRDASAFDGPLKRKFVRLIEINDIVLVRQDNLKRSDWLIGRVIDIYPGKNNQVRVVKVKTKAGELTRPVKKLYPFELSSHT